MKLERLALIAEIIGGITIVITLIVLIYETRQNTSATYAASYDQLAADMADWRMQLAGNPELQANYFAFIGPESEGQPVGAPYEREYETGVLAATALFYILERAYFARAYGRLGDQEWRRYEQSMCSNFSRRVFPRLSRGWFTDEFANFLDHCLEERR